MENDIGRKPDLTLVIDQGGHATRCIVLDSSGAAVSDTSAGIKTSRPAVGQVEHDARSLASSVFDVLSETALILGDDVGRLAGAALCTQRSSIVCWSRGSGEPLSQVLSWQDTRGSACLESLALDDREIRSITGLVRSAHYGASKMRWCIDNLSAVADAARRDDLAIGPLSSYLVHVLSDGQTFATDPANGSRTLLYDLESGDWSPGMLAAFGIDARLLPSNNATKAHWATLDVGGQLLPLSIVTGDQSAVPYAFADDPVGLCFLNLGTGAFIQCPVPDRREVPGLLNSVLCRSDRQTAFSIEGTVNGAGAALGWIAQQSRIDEQEMLASLPAWWAECASPPLFINSVGGIGSPFWKPGVTPRFNAKADFQDRAVAVVESIAFLITCNIEAMQSAGIEITEIVASGGLSTLEPLLQAIACLSGMSVLRSDYTEATAYGGARLCNPSLPKLAVDAGHTPVHRQRPGLRQRYAQWLALMHDA